MVTIETDTIIAYATEEPAPRPVNTKGYVDVVVVGSCSYFDSAVHVWRYDRRGWHNLSSHGICFWKPNAMRKAARLAKAHNTMVIEINDCPSSFGRWDYIKEYLYSQVGGR